MPKQLSVVCPQCKQGLTIDYENRKMAIICPDCQKLFRIGDIVETVVAKKRSGSSAIDSSASDATSLSQRFSRVTGEKSTKRAWDPISERARKYTERTKNLEKSSTEEILQVAGYFLLAAAVLGCLLPVFGFEFGRVVVPPLAATIFCGAIGVIGTGMILVANYRHNFAVAAGWCSGFIVLGLVVWAMCFDLSDYNSPFSWSKVTKSSEPKEALESLEQATAHPRRGASFHSEGSNSNNGPGESINGSPQKVTVNPVEPVIENQIAPFTSSNRPVDKHERKREKLQRSFGAAGTVRDGTQGEPIEIRQDFELRFQQLNQTPVLGGVAQSEEFNSKYVLSDVVGKQTNFGDALYNGRPVKGVDVAMGLKTSGVQFILPIYDLPKYSNSLYAKGRYLAGLNLHVHNGRIAGVQAVLCEASPNTAVVDDSKQLKSIWRGAATRGPAAATSGGRKIYGFVTYSDGGRIVGVQLILKR